MGSAPGAGVHVRSYARLPSLPCEEKSSRVKKHRHIYIYSLGIRVYDDDYPVFLLFSLLRIRSERLYRLYIISPLAVPVGNRTGSLT